MSCLSAFLQRIVVTSCILATICLQATCSAPASQQVTLHASLTPEQLGRPTTIGFGFQISTPKNTVPPALTGVAVRYPVHLGISLSEIGIETCTLHTLEYVGPAACPSTSLMGTGTAIAEIQIGPEILREKAQISIFRSVTSTNHIALLINAETITPLYYQAVLPGTILPASSPYSPYGGQLTMQIPLFEPLPDTPDIAVVKFAATLGPLHLHYHEYVHGHLLTYQPRGIPLPNKCPRHGFPFSATLTFQDGTHSNATTTVPCPSTESDNTVAAPVKQANHKARPESAEASSKQDA